MYTQRRDYSCSQQTKERILADLETFRPQELAGQAVTAVSRVDGSKFLLADGSWALVRPSGTEALFRIYAEASPRKNWKTSRMRWPPDWV